MKFFKIILGLLLVSTLIFYIGNIKMFKATNYFIEQLDSSYRSYGLGGIDHTEKTLNFNSPMLVTPVGRLIIIKIDKPVNENRYKLIKSTLEIRYALNKKNINNIYINKGGTVCIDCRR